MPSLASSKDPAKIPALPVLFKFFEDLNVESFGQKGEMMDPIIHEAMMTQEDKDTENDAILEVFEKGYTYRDKVIRHAKVIVNKK